MQLYNRSYHTCLKLRALLAPQSLKSTLLRILILVTIPEKQQQPEPKIFERSDQIRGRSLIK